MWRAGSVGSIDLRHFISIPMAVWRILMLCQNLLTPRSLLEALGEKARWWRLRKDACLCLSLCSRIPYPRRKERLRSVHDVTVRCNV